MFLAKKVPFLHFYSCLFSLFEVDNYCVKIQNSQGVASTFDYHPKDYKVGEGHQYKESLQVGKEV